MSAIFVHPKSIDGKEYILIHVNIGRPINFIKAKEMKIKNHDDQFNPCYYEVDEGKRVWKSDLCFWLGQPPIDSPPDWFDRQLTWQNTPEDGYTTGFIGSHNIIEVEDIVDDEISRKDLIDDVSSAIRTFFLARLR